MTDIKAVKSMCSWLSENLFKVVDMVVLIKELALYEQGRCKHMKSIYLKCFLMLCCVTEISASFSWSNRFKKTSRETGVKDSKRTSHVKWFDIESNTPKRAINKWNLSLGKPLIGTAWLGETFKEIPYTEKEFVELRNQKINMEIERLKKEHIAKEKENVSKEDSAEEVSNMLDSFLDDDDDDEEEDDEKKDSVEADKKYLKNFEERRERRKVMSRLFIPQSRSVLTKALFVQTDDLSLYCIDIKSGLTVWAAPITGVIKKPPYESKTSIYIVAAGKVLVLDKRSGFVTYKSTLNQAVLPMVYGKDKEIYSASYKNKLIAWHPEEHFEMWSERLWEEVSEGVFGDKEGLLVALRSGKLQSYGFDGVLKWEFVNKDISLNKIYYEKLLDKYNREIVKEKSEAKIGERRPDQIKLRKSQKGIDESRRKLGLLQYATRGKYLNRPVLDRGEIFMSSTDHNLYKLDRFSGLLKWNFNCGGELKSKTWVNKKVVWQKSIVGNLYCIDREEGNKLLMIKNVKKIYATTNKFAFYENNAKKIIVESKKNKDRLEVSRGLDIVIDGELGIVLALNPKNGSVYQYSMIGL